MKSAISIIILNLGVLACTASAQEQTSLNNCPWRLASQADVKETGEQISALNYAADKWLPATVPGTVLTTLVNNKVYPEPLYGENNRPDKIPDSLCRTSYWYRTTFTVPANYAGRKTWLNFDGINYTAEVWVNGKNFGAIKGAFARGIFDISSVVKPGTVASLAVRVSPQPNPGDPIEHNLRNGLGKNGGITAIDGPTFLCTIGWDWIPGIRDRNTGIWQKVFLSSSGPVVIKDPLVTSDLPLPQLDSADLKVQVTLKNESDQPRRGILKCEIGESGSPDGVAFQQPVEVPAHGVTVVAIDPTSKPVLHLRNPRLWWPNGYGPQNLYPVHLAFAVDGVVSDTKSFSIGIRKITYTVPGTDNLTVSVNGLRVMCKGGNWGMDEAMKRSPRQRLEAQVRMHQLANYTMIRNWVGQSTNEDLYDLCDQYGIMLWDEFFQPNPSDGPNPTDLETYLANCREKIVRFRNHPSIAVWCGRNEGRPPQNINDGLQQLMTELEPTRLYQPSSTDGHGVHSGGAYSWRSGLGFYNVDAPFKTEIGSVSVPTLEAVQAMMPQQDWETINDDWVSHDLGKGAQKGDEYIVNIRSRYGKLLNLADFVRKAQLANYEAFRAMYEGRFVKLFQPATGVLTWMSNPAQPSFVWQLYSWDLEPNASLFATRKACEPVHIMLNESNGHLQVINNMGTPLAGATSTAAIYNQDGTVAATHDGKVVAPASAATDLGPVELPAKHSAIYFVKLQLHDATGQLLSDNFYWRGGAPGQTGNLQDLQNLPVVKLDVGVKRHDTNGKCLLDVTLRNPSDQIALMAHLQLRRKGTGERVLPVYYSGNYLSLVPKESQTVTIEAATADLKGDQPLIVLDGWNIDVTPVASGECTIETNKNSQVANWPVTGLPFRWFNGPLAAIKIHCGGKTIKNFLEDAGYEGGVGEARHEVNTPADTSAASSAPDLYTNHRRGDCIYTFPMQPSAKGYAVRLYFAEKDFGPAAPPRASKPDPNVPAKVQPTADQDATGKRIFNVDINDQPVLTNFDIYVAAGARNKAVVKEFKNIMPDKTGNIRIQFRPGPAGVPKINGIEILPAAE